MANENLNGNLLPQLNMFEIGIENVEMLDEDQVSIITEESGTVEERMMEVANIIEEDSIDQAAIEEEVLRMEMFNDLIDEDEDLDGEYGDYLEMNDLVPALDYEEML